MKGPIKEAVMPALIATVKYVPIARWCNAADIRDGSVVQYRRKVVTVYDLNPTGIFRAAFCVAGKNVV